MSISTDAAMSENLERRFSKLSWDQVKILDRVLSEVTPIHGRGNFPTMEVKTKDMILVIRDELQKREIIVKEIRLNGSTVRHILTNQKGTSYKDLDIIFSIGYLGELEFQIVKETLLNCLLDFLPKGVIKKKITAQLMNEAYVQKMVKVSNEHDRWSLISLSNNAGKNMEFKFVDSIRRQFEFSVDSFQIILNSLLDVYRDANYVLSEESFPVMVAESMYGDFKQAMYHLQHKLISTRNPEEIRGGGLLKYSDLLVHDFKPASEPEIKILERYMCSRFFIDFPEVTEQQRRIECYLRNHFIGEEQIKYDYLMTLRGVINESTVCLMGHERRQTLNMITIMALKVLGEQNIIPNTANVTCYYEPAPYVTNRNFYSYYMAHGHPYFYQSYPLHINLRAGLL